MKRIVPIFISLFYIDLVFILISFKSISLETIIRILISNLLISVTLNFIKDDKKHKICSIITLAILSFYSFIQLEFKNFLETFYSFAAIKNGIGGVKGYIWYFISDAKPIYYIVFLSIVLFIILNKILFRYNKIITEFIYKKLYKDQYKKKKNKRKNNNSIIVRVLICTNLLTLTILSPLTSSIDDLVSAYTYNNEYDILLENIGINHFLFKDIYSSIFPKKIEFEIDTEEELIESIEDDTKEEITNEIDDSKWISLMNSETNESIKNIDEYLLSRSTNHETLHTGEFENYNFIYFLVESFDYIAIDKNLTPTLYKMWNDGYHFTNHYTPIFSCATGDSEFVSMTGLYPIRSVCTAYQATNTNLTTSLGGLFKEAGYKVNSFHNWDDQFYKRSQLEYAYGVDNYYDINDLDFKLIVGWQSDKVLIEKTLPYYIDDDKFFTFYITSSMHWPYDSESTLGDRYIKEINEYYPNYPIEVKRYISKSMELDKGLEYLINSLEEAGKLDNTVVSLFADHKPYKLTDSNIIKYSLLKDRTKEHGTDLTPFIIYNSKTKGKEINNPCSTIDHVPTIANLFNLNYDPRFYMGNDAFEDECIVLFNNMSWITKDGSYSKSKNTATKNLNQDYVDMVNSHVKNVTNICKAIIDYNYFEKRKSVIYPVYK